MTKTWAGSWEQYQEEIERYNKLYAERYTQTAPANPAAKELAELKRKLRQLAR